MTSHMRYDGATIVSRWRARAAHMTIDTGHRMRALVHPACSQSATFIGIYAHKRHTMQARQQASS